MAVIAPQAVGGRGPIPFWGAAHKVIFDNFTSDTWTPGAASVNLFQGALSQVKPYPYIRNLWLKFTSASGSGAGTFTGDGPAAALSLFRFQDPNGHAIVDTDGAGLWWRMKYGGRQWLGDPFKLPNAVTTAASPQWDIVVPFEFSPLGVGCLPNMDASGPYRIFATGNTSAAIYSTTPASTIPTMKVAVGLEAWSLPAPQSRINGAPQIQAPPPLDRGVVLVNEFTKQSYAINSGGGQQTIRLTRVGNIIRQLILVLRDSTGGRVDWLSANALAAGTTIQLAFDTNPLFQADPQHLIDLMARRRDATLFSASSTAAVTSATLDAGVLIVDFSDPTGLAVATDAFDAGMDSMIQTAQSSALELAFNWTAHAAGAGFSAGGTLEVYTDDITATTVTGQPYSFAYAGQLLAPTPPGQIGS